MSRWIPSFMIGFNFCILFVAVVAQQADISTSTSNHELINLTSRGSLSVSFASAPTGTSSLNATSEKKEKKLLRSIKVLGSILGSVLVCVTFALLLLKWRRKKSKLRRPEIVDELTGATRRPIVFSYRELISATNNFGEQNKLGQGGFGPVYKAILENGTLLAVKKLSVGSKQGKTEFANEISIITGIQHKNLVKLVGYCAEGEHRLLAYEFLEGSSLDRALFGQTVLNWQTRFQIVIGVAKGIAYLHEESQVKIIHRDIKASNILLDSMLQPKISDFGLSRFEDMTGDTLTTTKVAGTFGYMAPEYVSEGRLTTKADVFSFGVLALELVSGRKCIDPADEEGLLQKTWKLYNAGNLQELVDHRLRNDYIKEEAYRFMLVALFCIQELDELRPKMSEVFAMLMGYIHVPPLSTLKAPEDFQQLSYKDWESATRKLLVSGGSSSLLTILYAR